VTYRVRFTAAADEDVAAIRDTRTRSAVVRRAYALRTEPAAQGKPLQKDLKGLYSVRASGQRYRIVYRVQNEAGEVTVLVVGVRKEGDKRDAYQVARRRLRKL
jgi:mRNA interferase RelE/StbE